METKIRKGNIVRKTIIGGHMIGPFLKVIETNNESESIYFLG